MRWYPSMAIAKAPGATLDWLFDFSEWMAPGDSIASVLVNVDTGFTELSHSNDANTVTVWLTGGTIGLAYTVTVTVITKSSPPRRDERSVIFAVEAR